MPTRSEIISVLKLAQGAGVTLLMEFRAPDGYMQHTIDPEILADSIVEGRSAAAACVGLSDADYREWVENNGSVRCIANTRKGERCRKFVTGPHFTDPLKWKNANDAGGYCDTHGGD